MTEGGPLLDLALEAAGGLPRWCAARELVARIHSGGFALASKGRGRAFRDYEARIATDAPRVTITPYAGADRRGVFVGDEVRIEDGAGRVLAGRPEPRAAFRGVRRLFWWDPLDALYFAGYALWTYFTAPFLFLAPGVAAREGQPWTEGGERWRRLHVTFPAGLPTHSPEQVFYYDATGRLRRHDYTAEVFGRWARAAHYTSMHRTFDGLRLPTRRRVYPRRRDNRPRPFPTLVWIDVVDVHVR